MFYPRKRTPEYDDDARDVAYKILADAGYDDIPGLGGDQLDRIFVVNQRRGRAYYDKKAITIPAWIFLKAEDEMIGYLTYYVAHELAHHFANNNDNEWGHGKAFMKWFMRLCPKEYQHYELGYKPRNAAAAGIRKADGSKYRAS
jgi:hypothetical protein